MTPDECAEHILAETGLVVTPEVARAISQMVETERDDALAEAALVVMARPVNEDGLSYFEIMNRDQDMMLEILALKAKPAP